ncbi:MAG TPA: hypothetical protein VJL31_04740 [Gemmatimonadales bacterium]|nr:hypothetical protein [Gemmatimonadales bacterium]
MAYLAEASEQGEFLPDLHDRIRSGHTIELAPLRERPLDVHPLLVLANFQKKPGQVGTPEIRPLRVGLFGDDQNKVSVEALATP